jgi:hypothetical protein
VELLTAGAMVTKFANLKLKHSPNTIPKRERESKWLLKENSSAGQCRIHCIGIKLSASSLVCYHSLSSIAGGSGGSSLASILDGETSVNSSECVLSLYHPMALAAAAERLASKGFLLLEMS